MSITTPPSPPPSPSLPSPLYDYCTTTPYSVLLTCGSLVVLRSTRSIGLLRSFFHHMLRINELFVVCNLQLNWSYESRQTNYITHLLLYYLTDWLNWMDVYLPRLFYTIDCEVEWRIFSRGKLSPKEKRWNWLYVQQSVGRWSIVNWIRFADGQEWS